MKAEFNHRDVLIAGGGVAGLTAALHLLRRGLHVTLAEKQVGTPDKVCGEGILPFGVAELSALGLTDPLRQIGFPFAGVAYECEVNGDLQRVEGRFEHGSFGIGIDRGKLHQALLKTCREFTNFDYRQGCKIRLDDVADFDHVIAADGVNSSLGRAFGRRPVYSKRLGLRFRLAVPVKDMVRVRFLANAEIYLTPVGENSLSVAMLVDADRVGISGQEFQSWCLGQFGQAFPEFAGLEPRDIKARGPIASRVSGPLPPFPMLGDALRAFDPISGAGMSFALVCASRAAEHLTEPDAYYRAMRPVMRSVAGVTNTVLFFRGAGWRTKLMLRQLSRAPAAFQRILALHDGRHQITDLGWRHAISLLRV